MVFTIDIVKWIKSATKEVHILSSRSSNQRVICIHNEPSRDKHDGKGEISSLGESLGFLGSDVEVLTTWRPVVGGDEALFREIASPRKRGRV